MEKTIQRVMETKPHSAERAHVVEGIINEELGFNDLNLNDIYFDELAQLRKKLIAVKNYDDLTDWVIELNKFVEDLAEEIANEKGGE